MNSKYDGSRYFFRSAPGPGAGAPVSDPVVQIPSSKDLEQMKGMPAGGNEDQSARLKNMVEAVEKFAEVSVMDTDKTKIPAEWEHLFAAIKKGDEKTALAALNKIPKRDRILQALFAVHPMSYLQVLVTNCVKAKAHGKLTLPDDIVITPGTFEVLIKDLASTLFSSSKVCFSFGLPTHHAFSDKGSGFCSLDKTSILLMNKAHGSSGKVKFVIIGTDVNRDNGIERNLREKEVPTCHIDIFDSRVYPRQGHDYISSLFKKKGTDVGQKIQCWTHEKISYYAVDLSLTVRTEDSLHPALAFALKKLEEQIEDAKKGGCNVMLFLPTGWDSHQEETAYCAKDLGGKKMSKSQAQIMRFSDTDLKYFYEKILELYKENKQFVVGIYWGLEGGYYRPMYTKEIELLMSVVNKKLAPTTAMDCSP